MADTKAPSPTDKPRSIWDNDFPAGDSPPLPRWPLAASIAVYACWMVVLIAMMVVRLVETG